MSILTYREHVPDKPLVWLRGAIKSPPLSDAARSEVGMLLRMLQRGHRLAMTTSRPMPSIGRGCHELRLTDGNRAWRIIYRIDDDAIIIGDVFAKTTQKTPASIIDGCRRRFAQYDRDSEASEA